MDFEAPITTEAELREVLRQPNPVAADKAIDHIDDHCRSFIERSPFVLIGSSDGLGHFDISPKGDPAGFVRILDDRTLAIPDRPGNNRADTFTNVLTHPHVGLIFLVPGVTATLRVAGGARIVADEQLRESMAVGGRTPRLVLIVDVEEAMLHCTKCVIRSKLWAGDEVDRNQAEVSTLAEAIVEQSDLDVSVAELEKLLATDERENLY